MQWCTGLAGELCSSWSSPQCSCPPAPTSSQSTSNPYWATQTSPRHVPQNRRTHRKHFNSNLSHPGLSRNTSTFKHGNVMLPSHQGRRQYNQQDILLRMDSDCESKLYAFTSLFYCVLGVQIASVPIIKTYLAALNNRTSFIFMKLKSNKWWHDKWHDVYCRRVPWGMYYIYAHIAQSSLKLEHVKRLYLRHVHLLFMFDLTFQLNSSADGSSVFYRGDSFGHGSWNTRDSQRYTVCSSE